MNIKQKTLFILILGLAIGFWGLQFSSLAADKKSAKNSYLKKPQRNIDFAAGILDAGKLQNAVFNDGRLATWAYRPSVPAAFYKGWSYIPDLSMIIGIPEDSSWTPKKLDPVTNKMISMGPTVSERFVASDWGPSAGANGKLHSGDATVGDVLTGTSIGAVPLMATSTIKKSWPKDDSGNRFWPGPWAVDPITGKVLKGHFTSDKDIFFSITDYDVNDQDVPYADSDNDTLQGYPIGLKLDISGYSYGRSYAEDILFFPMKIINTSKNNYHGMYVGFYMDADIPEYNLKTTVNDRMDWMSFIKDEYDPETDSTYHYNMAYIYDYRWGTGDFSGVSDPDAWKVYASMKLLDTPVNPKTGEQLGITDWHWFQWENRPGIIDSKRQELIQYKVISGDTSGLTPEESDAYFWPDPSGHLDPHFDSPEGIRTMYPDGLDCVFIMSSGPFDLAAGDTAVFSFAMIMGDNLKDLKFNARTAQFMYNLHYQGANPPIAPHVTAVPGKGRITLYWDRVAESSIDIMTGYQDFEGYRIYRTTSNPVNNEWGTEIRNDLGNVVEFVPVAQFDLADGIKGPDPQNPYFNLGNDTGLKHSWTDSTVLDGVTYWYAVAPYDRGVRPETEFNPDHWPLLAALETAKGTNPDATPNLVEVVPGPKPSTYVPPEIVLKPKPGTLGNGKIKASIIDPVAITGHTYEISFDDTTTRGKLLYNVWDATDQAWALKGADETRGQEGPFFDGLQLLIDNYQSIGLLADSSGWTTATGDSTDVTWTYSATGFSNPHNYEIRFTDEGDTSVFMPPLIRVPFEVWDVTVDQKLDFISFAASTDTTPEMKNTWTSGDAFMIREKVRGRVRSTFSFKLEGIPDTVITTIDTTINGADTTIVDTTITPKIPPKTGDVLHLITTKPFKRDRDVFVLETSHYKLEKRIQQKELKMVRVVPNPYIVSAEWDLNPYIRHIQFRNLPNECVIRIFTLTGDKVKTIHHKNATQGWEFWNMQTYNGQEIAYGLYLYIIETPDGKTQMGKFAVIK
ncbi:hypothetical protein BMS3Abin05_00110 [bacterium BMS3Abin05]|nr:hypothetical protein BMS3Abin05_00110 [bacterium BMS3Abin05]GBE26886.1 hypothetical protein BMS3Bbin03_00806 [bacterium BMS3Bbin03]